MTDFEISVRKTLVHEGGYVNNPNDSGGPTKYGITQKDLPNTDIQNLSEDDAIDYYVDHYWKAFYSQIKVQMIADKLFDMGVLFGVGTAVKTLQIVLSLTVDCNFGPHTLEAVNSAEPVSLLAAYKAALVSHAIGIANASPKDRIFLAGWITRVNS